MFKEMVANIGEESFLERPRCKHLWRGEGGIDSAAFGLNKLLNDEYKGCVNETAYTPESGPQLNASCGPRLAGPGVAPGFHECNFPPPEKRTAYAYLAFSMVLASLMAYTILQLLHTDSTSGPQQSMAVAEMPIAFPRIEWIAKEEGSSVDIVVHRSTTFFMLIEAALLDGDLVDCFSNMVAGVSGAALQCAYVLGLAMPFHLSALLLARNAPHHSRGGVLVAPFSSMWSLPTILLLIYYPMMYLFAVGYYTRNLPLGFCRGGLLKLFRLMSRLFILLALSVFCLQSLWLISSYFFNPKYVTELLILLASGVALIYSGVSTAKEFFAIAQKKAAKADEPMDAKSVLTSIKTMAMSAVKVDMTGVQNKLRPLLEPMVHELGLKWEDVLPMLQTMDDPVDIAELLTEPRAFLRKPEAAGGPLATKLLHAQLSKLLIPLCEERKVSYDIDVLPFVKMVDSFDELRAALQDPRSFIDNVIARSLSKPWLTQQLKVALAPHLAEAEVGWAHVQPAIEQIERVEELKQALLDPRTFANRLMSTLKGKEPAAAANVRASCAPATTAGVAVPGAANDAGQQEEQAAEMAQLVSREADGKEDTHAKFKSALNALALKRTQLRNLFLQCGVAFVGTAIFIMWGLKLWRADEKGISYETIVMPFLPLYAKLKAHGILGEDADASQPDASEAERKKRTVVPTEGGEDGDASTRPSIRV